MRQPFSSVLWIAVMSLSVCVPVSAEQQDKPNSPSIGSREELIGRCLRVNRFFMEKYTQKEGPLVIEPVALPWGEELLGNNSHFGWPVATKAGDAVIVVYLRQPQHTPRFGIEKPKDEFLSKVMMTRSTDGCQTWSKPVDMRTFVQTATEGCRLGFGNGMVTLADGTVVLVSEYGVFRSGDQGATWEHLPQAFSEAQLPGDKANNGPRVIEHPKFGLVTFAHGKGSDLIVRYSQDRGETWHEIVQKQPEIAQAVEPAAMMHDGALIIVARCHSKESFEPDTRTWRYLQMVSRDGWLPLTPALTTMRVTDITDEIAIDGYGPWSQDTVDVSYNPVTRRIETVATNRNGGGQGREQQRLRMTLNLWSIDPQQLLDGSSDWRFEGTLIARTGNMVTGTDGMHPGGAVIDEKAGVQHIFVYMGEHLGPAGIFRITRALDTPALKAFIEAHPE
ncbi:MAG: exo-alpha-sialidase [Phycisphaeraceae bacterium]|nr:exo-alpha-sialidase [Phycisphaeraceae bacterium]